MPERTDELRAWIANNLSEQFEFGHGALLPRTVGVGGGVGGGFGWMLDDGSLDGSQPQLTWLTSRLVHVYSVAALLGVTGASEIATAGFAGVTDALHDDVNGGWFSSVGPAPDDVDDSKACYAQAHVAIAAAAASAIGVPRANEVLDEALTVLDEHFWDESTGTFGEADDRRWSSPSTHRSATANMHAVEAMLSAAAVTPAGSARSVLLERALRVVDRLAHREAASNDWRMPQYFTAAWAPLPEYNRANPTDPFAPYGATIGLGFEWARLTIGVRDAIGPGAPGWMLESARQLHARAATDGWASDGQPGFVYTTSWTGAPVIDRRLHWVQAEAVSSAATLQRATGEELYGDQLSTWWGYIRSTIVDPVSGSWRHELDPQGQVSTQIWRGRPDLYHSVNAEIISLGSPASTPLEICRDGLLPLD